MRLSATASTFSLHATVVLVGLGCRVTYNPRPQPRRNNFDVIVALSAGAMHTCVTSRTGISRCWGLTKFEDNQPMRSDDRGLRRLEATNDVEWDGPFEQQLESDTWVCRSLGCFRTFELPYLGLPPLTVVPSSGFELCKTDIRGATECTFRPIDRESFRDSEYAFQVHGIVSQVIRNARITCLLDGTRTAECSVDRWRSSPGATIRLPNITKLHRFESSLLLESLTELRRLQFDESTGELSTVPYATIESGATVAVGEGHVCFLQNGAVRCQGDNRYGQLGPFSLLQSESLMSVPHLPRIRTIVAGAVHTCALGENGRVCCWGDESLGRLRARDEIPTAVRVGGLPGAVVAAVAGLDFTCAMLADREVRCWGRASSGSVGIGQSAERFPTALQDWVSAERSTPHAIVVGRFEGATELLSRYNTVCAVGATTAHCWGGITTNELYLPQRPRSTWPREPMQFVLQPVAVELERARALMGRARGPSYGIPRGEIVAADSPGWALHCGVQRGRGLVCVDRDPHDVRVESNERVLSPIESFVDISISETHACAWTREGDLWCWGSNRYQQLGTGIVPEARTPRVMELP